MFSYKIVRRQTIIQNNPKQESFRSKSMSKQPVVDPLKKKIVKDFVENSWKKLLESQENSYKHFKSWSQPISCKSKNSIHTAKKLKELPSIIKESEPFFNSVKTFKKVIMDESKLQSIERLKASKKLFNSMRITEKEKLTKRNNDEQEMKLIKNKLDAINKKLNIAQNESENHKFRRMFFAARDSQYSKDIVNKIKQETSERRNMNEVMYIKKTQRIESCKSLKNKSLRLIQKEIKKELEKDKKRHHENFVKVKQDEEQFIKVTSDDLINKDLRLQKFLQKVMNFIKLLEGTFV